MLRAVSGGELIAVSPRRELCGGRGAGLVAVRKKAARPRLRSRDGTSDRRRSSGPARRPARGHGPQPRARRGPRRLRARPMSPPPARRRQRSRVPRPDGLTGREAQVLELLADGDTNNEIAAELVVSVHTVERHLQNAYRKIGVRNRADAAAYMVRAALNPPEIGITVPVHIPVPDGTDRTAHPGQDSVQPADGKKWVFGRSSSWPSRKMSVFSL